jgi:hypothetical protein
MSKAFENHKDKRIKEIHERLLNYKLKKKKINYKYDN